MCVVRIVCHNIFPCSGWGVVECPGCLQSDEDIIRFSPVDTVVEPIIQQSGVIVLQEDVVGGIDIIGSLNLQVLQDVQCRVCHSHEGHIGLALNRFLKAGQDLEGRS